MNNVHQNNIVIALFMGFEWKVQNYHGINILENSEGETYDVNRLRYHDSWDWLMKVVEKIESFTNEYNGSKYNVQIESIWVEIINNHTSDIIITLSEDTKIQSVYEAVLQFIKLYNEN